MTKVPLTGKMVGLSQCPSKRSKVLPVSVMVTVTDSFGVNKPLRCIHSSGGSRIFPGVVRTYFFDQKLHENERILAPGRGGGASLAPSLDPPLHSHRKRKISLMFVTFSFSLSLGVNGPLSGTGDTTGTGRARLIRSST